MTIPFHCPGCEKTANVPDSYGGKKVKCKYGTVVAVAAPTPVAADDFDLDNVQFQAVEDPRKKAAAQAKRNSGEPKLTKKQREEKLLAEKLGQDWKNPKPEYYQVMGDEREHWIIEIWYAMQGSPMIALGVFAASILMICMGVMCFDMIAEQLDDLDAASRVRIGRRGRGSGFLAGPVLMGLGTLGAAASLYVIVMGLGSPELKNHYPKWKITFIIVGMIVMCLVLAAFIVFRAMGGG